MCPKGQEIFDSIMGWDDPNHHVLIAHKKVCDECDYSKRPSGVIDLQRLQKWILRHTRQKRLI